MAHAEDSPICRQWLEKVTQAPKDVEARAAVPAGGSTAAIVGFSSDPWDIASISETAKLKAIQCLLGAENDTKTAAFSGANRFDISQTFAPAEVNLAALYAISYIYSGHYDHAAAVALRGEDASYTDSSGNYVTKANAIHKAYKAYREWFTKVRQIGLPVPNSPAYNLWQAPGCAGTESLKANRKAGGPGLSDGFQPR